MLAIVTCGNLVYRFCTWMIPSMRGRLVVLEGLGFWANAGQAEQIALYLRGVPHADWLIIYYLAQSMDKANFYNFLVKMCGTEETHSDEDNEDEENEGLFQVLNFRGCKNGQRPAEGLGQGKLSFK